MSVINTNITSMIGQQNLNESKNALTTSMERLSSGLRINSAKDDAAGQAIANRMSAQITGLSQASRNANDGISIAQTAEGSLNQINDNLQRVRELTVQAQNGTNSDSDLQSIQDEVNQRLNEINRISEETDFNGVKVLSEDVSTIAIQVGANDGESISVNLETINQKSLSLDGFDLSSTLRDVSAAEDRYSSDSVLFNKTDMQAEGTVTTASELDSAGTSIDGYEFGGEALTTGNYEVRTFEGEQYVVGTAGDVDGKVFSIDSVDEASGALTVNIGNEITGQVARAEGDRGSSFDFQDGTSGITASDYDISVVTNNSGDRLARAVDDQGGISYYDISAEGKAQTDGSVSITLGSEVAEGTGDLAGVTTDPMKKLDDALSKVDSLRSELGAVQNRFEDAISNLSTNETNLSAARSRIEDADYATEVANMTKNQILQQAGTSVLAQANQLPQSVLSLLG
ncbi:MULTISPECIES: FliC/FljB family flagellin [unclassified Halomonas]|uniref:FliC/FljB family flagellin n=1 Tax=unclassified Halomonas TaxID=2609666 RepID=UPI002888525A|nr:MULTISPECIES: FliC/FljB family flagellin [unclassified Halomonas]MDT0500490.1 FliC/FljB family flagellin [Halomonas sp. PAR7]MDT0511614.1 FliC/FljB family flagellin [Halomonas sp. LES1]